MVFDIHHSSRALVNNVGVIEHADCPVILKKRISTYDQSSAIGKMKKSRFT